MKFKNLLIICNTFPDKDNTFVAGIFVKEQVKHLKKYFENIYVISPVAYGMEYLRKTHLEKYTFDNVHVYFPKYFNLPFFYFHFRDFWVNLEYSCIYDLIKRENLQFDLVHAHYTWPSGAVAIELKKKFRVPVVITEHTHITLYKELKKKNKQYINTWKQCDAIIRVNKKDIPLIVDQGEVPAQKIFHVVNGFDPLKFKYITKDDARHKLGLKNDLKIVYNVGRLYEEKGQNYLIDAINEVVKTRKDVLCIIGGSGPLRDKLQNQINDLNLQNHVLLIGFVPDELLSFWMYACDVFVLPSLSEGNPTVMFECLGCGKPFVGTKVGGVPEIIISDDYGLVVEPKNSKDLANMIKIALDKKWDSQHIKRYGEKFTWENITKDIISVYMKI
ncbi:glycosyltransferase [Methanosarcina barkeri]|uniref:Glycosyl transferase, group 1 n=1 Tax=Methanosarcina barkeri 227 TaxID=1434106 RepID=A0A0E3R384_METBA|nr:glycosyltransferase [Methanosarcina barkeri]AKB58118.1 glycosyl transferase, group 1 [Methanosarcina barkeri 227]